MATNIRRLTVEQYLALEAESEVKHEYIDGEIFAMTGGSANHSAIIAYTIAALINQLDETECVVRASDMRVKINELRYVYPDISVVCGESSYGDDNETTLLNPTLIVEVTSPSSMAYDHVSKVEFYGALASVQAYLILDQQRVFAELYSRAASGWHLQQFSDLADVIPLDPLNCSLPLAQVYRGVGIEA